MHTAPYQQVIAMERSGAAEGAALTASAHWHGLVAGQKISSVSALSALSGGRSPDTQAFEQCFPYRLTILTGLISCLC